MSETVLVLVDGPNADNQACAWGALNAFPDKEVLVAVSATAAHNDPDAPLGSRDIPTSRRVQEIHTARMAGLMARAGLEQCVYMGLRPEETDITSVVPHSSHVSHEEYDIKGDAHGFGREHVAGTFDDLLTRLERGKDKIDIVVGGPFSEVPPLIENSLIVSRLGELAGQAAFSLSERAIYSKLAFNVDVDMLAALKTLLWYPGRMTVVPSDITRHPSVTYKDHVELTSHGLHPEIAEIYTKHRLQATERHEAEQLRRKLASQPPLRDYPALSIHDLQAVLALRYTMGMEDPNLYTLAPIDVAEAVANMVRASHIREEDGFTPTITPEIVAGLGYLGGNSTTRGEIPERLVVVGQNAALYKQRVPELLGPLNRA